MSTTPLERSLKNLLIEAQGLGFAEAINKVNPAKVPTSAVIAFRSRVAANVEAFKSEYLKKSAVDFGQMIKEMENAE